MAQDEASSAGYANASYAYSYTQTVKTPALAQMVPQEQPHHDWLFKFGGSRLVAILEEGSKFVKNILAQKVHDFVDGKPATPQNTATVEDYFSYLIDSKDIVVTTSHVEPESKIVITDAAFADYRVAGPNPFVIKLATADDLKVIGHEFTTDKELLKLIDQKHLFIIDYSVFATLNADETLVDGRKKLSVGSVALFRLEGNHLAPVLIKVIGHTRHGQSKVFRPSAPGSKLDFGWAIAKAVFNSNDSNYHEAFVHLGGTHLVSEAFLVASNARLRTDHPIMRLLKPHFEGTAFINDQANTKLISDGGIISTLVSSEIGPIRDMTAAYNAEMLSSDLRFPERVKAHKMDKETVPELDYPFRDDGMLHWKAIYDWVTAYIQIFYPSDDAVAKDHELQHWINELRDCGKVTWLNNFKYTVTWLVDVIASIIFIASVEHASVNFPQRSHMQFVPAFPLGLYGDESSIFSSASTEHDLLNILPPVSNIKVQVEVAYTLGHLVYKRLGTYGDDGYPHNSLFELFGRDPDCGYFTCLDGKDSVTIPKDYHDRICKALKKYRSDLKSVSDEMNIRNKKRQFPYITILPENVPQSVNV